MSAKSEEQLQSERIEIVTRQVNQLRRTYISGQISGRDHDRVGLLMQTNIVPLLELSDTAWDMFTEFVEEARQWRKDNGIV